MTLKLTILASLGKVELATLNIVLLGILKKTELNRLNGVKEFILVNLTVIIAYYTISLRAMD